MNELSFNNYKKMNKGSGLCLRRIDESIQKNRAWQSWAREQNSPGRAVTEWQRRPLVNKFKNNKI